MSDYKPMGSVLLGYVKDYRRTHGSSLLEAKRAVEAGWRPGDVPPPPDPRDAEIATLRERLAKAEAERAVDKAEIARWREVVAQGMADLDASRERLAAAEAERDAARQAARDNIDRTLDERERHAASRALADRMGDAARDVIAYHPEWDGCEPCAALKAVLSEWEEARR